MKKHYRKLRLLFSFILVSTSVTLFAAINRQTIHSSIKWNGTEKWYVDSLSREVVVFTNAQFPENNFIPYYVKEIPAERGTISTAVIKNATYAPLTEKEQKILENNGFASEPEIITYSTVSRGSESTQIQVLPFVNKNGKILKLLDFDIELTQKSAVSQAPESTIHTYADNSVLASGKFTKIRIKDSGVYKLTYDDLNSMGIDPANVKIFGYGGAVLEQSFALKYNDDLPEIPIYINKGSDGVFNSGDYILFYAQGTVKWSFDSSKGIFTHTNNPYSNYGYYFVTSDAGVGKKIETADSEVPEDATVYDVSEFVDYQLHEKDLFNFCSSGKEFYGEKFTDITSYNFTFSFPNIVTGKTSVTARLDAASSASATATYNLSLDGSQTQSLSIAKKTDGDNYEQAKAANGTYAYTPNSDNLAFNITYLKPNSTALGYLNYLEINARRKLTMSGTSMPFQNLDYLGLEGYSKFHLANPATNTQIWDISDPLNIKALNTTAETGGITFTASSNDVANYLAIDPTQSSSFSKPDIVGTVPNQNLHNLQPVNMVIITYPDFKSQAETLAQAHRDMDGLSVAVVTTDQVYNEFSSGAPDATAYRWIMKMLYDRALNAGNKTDMPKYLLLFGRGSFDNKKLLTNSGDNLIMTYQSDNSLVLTQSYVTDDYFAFLDDNEGVNIPANRMDIGVGRFPVTNQTDATNVVTKTINYMKNQDKGSWKNQICFVADDGDAALHVKQADSIAINNNKLYPSYQVNKIYLDAFTQEVNASGQTYPLAKTKLKNLINTGIIMFDYTGHAGTMGLANESILSINDVKSLTNTHLPIWVGATCDFLQFDVENVSAGEHVVTNLNGGGIGILSAARTVYASQNFNINKAFTDTLFVKNNGTEYRVGDVLMKAKNKVGTESNKLSYVYMGDPAVKLNYPTDYTVTTTKINDDATLTNDTLKALSIAKIEGEIRSFNGTKATNFNGTIHVVVYDKAQRITTLNNEGDGAYTYTDRPNTLFSGKAEVKNGDFKFTFMLPKDIKYNFGSGRINYYAQDDVNNKEAQGYYESFIVGGTSTNYYNESDGPDVKMYLNSENFVSGNKVNQSPLFIAQVNDTNGINTVGSGIGHDIVLTIDKDASQSYVLNDYFIAETNSYTTGSVSYQLPTMEEGKHTISFRIWDLLNNSTDKTIEFEVVKGLSPVIFNMISYPNPAVTNTTIKIVSDRPQNVKTTKIDIFDLAGRHIWTFTQDSADEVTWDLSGADGKSIRPGAYLYKATITMNDGTVATKTNKIIVIKQ